MDTKEHYDPRSFWDKKARNAGSDFQSAVCLDSHADNRIIDSIQRRHLRMAFHQINQQTDLVNRKILDYGCGTGRWVEFFQYRGMKYTGVDISPEMVRIASDRFPRCNFSVVGNKGTDFPPEFFDVICSIAVIHHNPYKKQISILNRLCESLKQKGFLVLFESVGQSNTDSSLEFPRTTDEWAGILKNSGLELTWSNSTRYFATRTIMNKLIGENRLKGLTDKLGYYLDPYLGGLLPLRLHTRGTMVFQKLAL